MKIIVGYFALFIAWSSAVNLDCTFEIYESYWGAEYACVVKNLQTSVYNRKITSITGTHLTSKTNDDVAKVLVEFQNCPYLPLNLGAFFENLEILYVTSSNVVHLTSNDLDGLRKLRIFDVSHNPITQIHRDFFAGHESIEKISFFECKLEYIQKGSLDPLVNLKEGHFQNNDCIDFRGDDPSLIDDLKKEILSCDSLADSCEENPSENCLKTTTTPEVTTTTRTTTRQTTTNDSSNQRHAVRTIIFLVIASIFL
jgi:hypothetical protein